MFHFLFFSVFFVIIYKYCFNNQRSSLREGVKIYIFVASAKFLDLSFKLKKRNNKHFFSEISWHLHRLCVRLCSHNGRFKKFDWAWSRGGYRVGGGQVPGTPWSSEGGAWEGAVFCYIITKNSLRTRLKWILKNH